MVMTKVTAVVRSAAHRTDCHSYSKQTELTKMDSENVNIPKRIKFVGCLLESFGLHVRAKIVTRHPKKLSSCIAAPKVESSHCWTWNRLSWVKRQKSEVRIS